MSICYIEQGSLLDDLADALVCPVNCVPGVMGAGLARQFAERWPGLVAEHAGVVSNGFLGPGGIYQVDPRAVGRRVIFAATKDHWNSPSQVGWVHRCLSGLTDLALVGSPHDLPRSVALPALGCGLGGLGWGVVRAFTERMLARTEAYGFATEWRVYTPQRGPRR